MSDKIQAQVTDAAELFDVDFTENPVSSGADRKPKLTHDDKVNPYAGVEDVLGLPRGSTKEGIAAARADVQRLTGEAKVLGDRAKIVKQKEHTAQNLAALGDDAEEIAGFSLATLAEDRKILRAEYMGLLRRGKAILDRIENDLNDLVNPAPEDYANYQRQYLAVVKTLDSITNALVTLRKEEEISNQKTGGTQVSGSSNAVQGAGSDGGTPAPDGSIELTPRDTNAWIEKWTAELNEEMAKEIQDEYNARVEKRAGEEGQAALPAP